MDDPQSCCARDEFIDCADTMEGCKNYPYAGGELISTKMDNFVILVIYLHRGLPRVSHSQKIILEPTCWISSSQRVHEQKRGGKILYR